jgi:NAD(P)-dependent dehydrogenase (short-subunit alcohol dehydrogenase family)
MREVTVVIGVGGIGIACARRLGAGQRLVLADFNAAGLEANAAELRASGYDVITQQVDIADAASVAALVATVSSAGSLRTLINTAGLSPTMAPAKRIYAVDLLGTALVIDAFLPLARVGTAAVMIASMAPAFVSVPTELESKLALSPAADLLSVVGDLYAQDPNGAYGVSKRGNQLRVEAAAAAWGAKGARIVSVSPGLIHTSMQQQEEKANDMITGLRKATPMDRYGTAEDIAAGVEWLVGPNASLVSGIDLRIDGGIVAAIRWSQAAK